MGWNRSNLIQYKSRVSFGMYLNITVSISSRSKDHQGYVGIMIETIKWNIRTSKTAVLHIENRKHSLLTNL